MQVETRPRELNRTNYIGQMPAAEADNLKHDNKKLNKINRASC